MSQIEVVVVVVEVVVGQVGRGEYSVLWTSLFSRHETILAPAVEGMYSEASQFNSGSEHGIVIALLPPTSNSMVNAAESRILKQE